MFKKIIWALFGNDDDGTCGQVTLQRMDGWLTERLIERNPHLKEAILSKFIIPWDGYLLSNKDEMLKEFGHLINWTDYVAWWIRNPFFNLSQFVLNWPAKTDFPIWNDKGGFLFRAAPFFVSYRGKHVEWYAGFKGIRGAFGFVLRRSHATGA